MKKINVVQKNLEFNRIIKNNFSQKFSDYIIYIEYDTNDIYHFGISVSKKIGNAVVRNKIKRRIRSIIDNYHYKNDFNCIIIVRRSILKSDYSKMNKDLYDIFKKCNILKEGTDETKK